ncbi:MAG: ribonuclease HII [Patescibacteria group bacterium]|nr:ribonuclease HII [Patescibacteria group bacterium]MCL5224292.1 ribonuclease HII [Patescibacteria group bacterium]
MAAKSFKVGIDEVGRGSLAGPVVVAAVLLESGWRPQLKLRDSKKLSVSSREEWFSILKRAAIPYAISRVSAAVIDKINISSSANRAAARSFNRLLAECSFNRNNAIVYLDGGLYIGSKRRQEALDFPVRTMPKADERINAVKLASIVAKVTRDRYMTKLDAADPRYKFGLHKGYGTKEHRTLIRKHGPSSNHRLTFLSKTVNI